MNKTVDSLYLSASDTAAMLGISVATLYAYVSRGLIRSRRMAGSKRRLYWRADVNRLRRADASTGDTVLPTSLVDATRITLLTAQGHYYRGVPASALARTATLESVSALLWQADEATIFGDELPKMPTELFLPGQPQDSLWQRTMALLFMVEQADPRAYNLTREGYSRSAADALRCVAASCLDRTELSSDPIHLLVCRQLGAAQRFEDVVRQYLVLAADHELDPTTYAVRAAANTGVTPYAAIAAGLLTSSGRRLVFGQTGSIARLFEELEANADPQEAIVRRLRIGEPVAGFGSSSYPDGDPRAAHMLALLDDVCADDPAYARLQAAIATMRDATGLLPSFVIPALFLERTLGIRTDQTTLLRLARVVGWIAHAMEQYYDSGLVRPHANYTGELPDPESFKG